MDAANDISFFAETNNRGRRIPVGIRQADRLSHMYIVGKTGVGKSTLMETLAVGDLQAGRGFALIDPHGDLAERVASVAKASGRKDVTYLNPADPTCRVGFNPLRKVAPERIAFAASAILEAFQKLWPSAWGVRMEHVLRSTLYALLEQESMTLADIPRLYADVAFRRGVMERVGNPLVRAFWENEFEPLTARQQAELVAPILNKMGAVLSDPALYRTFVHPEIDLNLRTIMDEGGVLIANLSKGRLGEDSSSTLGSLLVSTLSVAAFSRADVPPNFRRSFALFVDEFQTFTTSAFASMVSELRKQAVGIVIANQSLYQLGDDIRVSIMGSVGTLVSFRLGTKDAIAVSAEFQTVFSTTDLIRLPNRAICLRLMIDQSPSVPFSVRLIKGSNAHT